MIHQYRLDTANEILKYLHPEEKLQLVMKNSRIHAQWENSRGKHEKPWLCRSGSFYPSIHRQIATGGTHITAISQLVRWVRFLPVLPLTTWEYWFSPAVGMRGKDEILPLLENAQYPKTHHCLWCGEEGSRFDWYSIGKQEGPGCLPQCDSIRAAVNNPPAEARGL